MKCRLPIIIIGLSLIILTSDCQKQESSAISFTTIKGNKVLLCDIDKISETRELKLSEIVEYSELIRLSNDTTALIGDTWLRCTSSNHLFFANMQNTLFLFDNKGNFIKSWKQGNGPNEFIIPGFPQLIDDKVYVQDLIKGNLIEYSLISGSERTIKIKKRDGINHVMGDSELLSVGNSTSPEDPYLICLQDFEGNVLQSIKAQSYINLGTQIVGEYPTLTPINKGWNIHFPTNDTLMHYSIEKNILEPIAVFQSVSHIENNIKHYEERKKNDLNISSGDPTSVVKVVPEYETKRYYFLSVYKYGEKEDKPWFMASRQICLVDKKSQEAFYVNFTNDFWGDIPFSTQGNSLFWSSNIVQDFSALRIKKQFNELIEAKDETLDNVIFLKIKNTISQIDENDNNLVFWYKLKEDN